MPHIVDTRGTVRTAVGPGESRTQISKHPIDLARREHLSPAPPACADEEGCFLGELDQRVAQAAISPEGLDHARVQRHLGQWRFLQEL
jgi:hypothetical protein